MKNILRNKALLLILFWVTINPLILLAQTSDWEWVRTFGGTGADEINSSCLDAAGNLYIAGYFQHKIDIDGIELNAKGDNDILIAKFTDKGNLVWAKQAGGSYSENLIISEYAKKIKIDTEDNIIIAGVFMWEADFDGQIIKGTGNSIFIAKYSQSGKLIWVRSFGSQQHDFLYDMDIDNDNNIYLTGYLTGAFINDTSETDFKGNEYDGPGTTPFVAGLNSEGNLKWLRRDIGSPDKTLISIDNDKIYYAVEYSSDLLMSDAYHSASGNKDFIVQCLNKDGIVQWQRKFSSEFDDIIESLRFADENSILITGKFGNIPALKSGSESETKLDLKTYFSRIKSDGSISWTVNNDSPTFPGGTMLATFNNDTYYSTDVFTTDINIEGNKLIPDESWFNSYLALHDKSGRIQDILLNTQGIIKSVLPTNDNKYIVAGNFLFTSNPPFNTKNDGGFIDFFIGQRKLQKLSDSTTISKVISPMDFNMIVYPNPAKNYCNISCDGIESVERINITGINGTSIVSFSMCKLPYFINLSELSSGQYIVSLVYNNIISSKILTIE